MSSDKVLQFIPPKHGYLQEWSQRGVLLLNTTLTVRSDFFFHFHHMNICLFSNFKVERGKPKSHANKGWETFTECLIDLVNSKRKNVVFFLWGSHAQTKGKNISKEIHLVLTSVHPSPLSASTGFFGCRHFSKANEYLQEHNISPVDWTLSP
jgi:uracil-DNA glycosylase